MSEHFAESELVCHCGCGKLPQPQLVEFLELVRVEVDFAMILSSVARCARYNKLVSYTGDNGPHVLGLGVDVYCSGERAYILLATAIRVGATGIGIAQHGAHRSRYLHFDIVPRGGDHPRPFIWSY